MPKAGIRTVSRFNHLRTNGFFKYFFDLPQEFL